jgi:FlaA1/EpsC-like NDP-sugar epimerase
MLKNPKLYLMIALDAACCALALLAAYALRFEFHLQVHVPQMLRVLAWYLPLKLTLFWLFGLYRGMWRFTGIQDLVRLGQAVLAALLSAVAFLVYANRFQGYSRSVFFVDALLTCFLCGGLRTGIRAVYAGFTGSRLIPVPAWLSRKKGDQSGHRRVLIIGAGCTGEKMLREIYENPELRYTVVGFLDDAPSKRNRSLHGVPVLGSVDDLPRVTALGRVEEIFIATPSATGPQMRRIVEACRATGIPFKTLPALGALMEGKVTVRQLREINYQDLLRRPPVVLDHEGIGDYLTGKTVLVTGAGGSIGSELCRQLVRFRPSRLILLDAGEANLYQIQMELHHEWNFRDYDCVLGRVQDRRLMERVFSRHRPQVVFHAAAYKHVPMLEHNPWQAVENNILGSQVAMQLADAYGAERFVLVSTDKAVRPTNVMGASKRVAELILQSYKESRTRFMAVRFGNVLGSSGSVIPLFLRQIERGGPVAVTHPEVTRYFMTIPEAARLILQAGALGEGGEIFVLEMGTPVKIAQMAEDLIRLCGKRPGTDIEIVFTGLREGEKLYEELITQDEGITRTAHEKILVLRPNGHDKHSLLSNPASRLEEQLQALYLQAKRLDGSAIRQTLQEIVPEFLPKADSRVERRSLEDSSVVAL